MTLAEKFASDLPITDKQLAWLLLDSTLTDDQHNLLEAVSAGPKAKFTEMYVVIDTDTDGKAEFVSHASNCIRTATQCYACAIETNAFISTRKGTKPKTSLVRVRIPMTRGDERAIAEALLAVGRGEYETLAEKSF